MNLLGIKMSIGKAFLAQLSFVCLFCSCFLEEIPESLFGRNHLITDKSYVSIQHKKDESDELVTKISSFEDLDNLGNGRNIEVKRKIVICDEKKYVNVQLTIQGYALESSKTKNETVTAHDKIRLQKIGGKNAVISNNGLTVHRKNEEGDYGYAGILTNRPLKDNEMFEINIDRVIQKHGSAGSIGITPLSPTEIKYESSLIGGTIMLYNDDIYQNKSIVKKNYGPDLKKLKPGDKIGLMKADSGNLNFFVNGADLGTAVTGVSYPVYGVVDVYGQIVQATIV